MRKKRRVRNRKGKGGKKEMEENRKVRRRKETRTREWRRNEGRNRITRSCYWSPKKLHKGA